MKNDDTINVDGWICEYPNYAIIPAKKEYKIEVGDLLFLKQGFVLPANAFAPGKNFLEMQEFFSSCFVGVANRASDVDEENEIDVILNGLFIFNCPYDEYTIGQYVGVAFEKQNSPLNQYVGKVFHKNLSIGRVLYSAKFKPVNRISVCIKSNIFS